MLSVLYLTLADGEDSVLLRLDPDPGEQRRALARVGPYALSYLDHALPPGLLAGVPELTRRCEQLGASARTEREALRTLAGAVELAYPESLLRLVRRVAPGQVVRRWPVGPRSGAPAAGQLWPFDAELMGLLLGRRQLVLREWDSDPGAGGDQRWLQAHGLHVRTLRTPDGTIAQLAARSEALGVEAAGQLTQAWSQGPGQAPASRWMGEALGYPACCIARFTRRRARDELTLLADQLPPWGDRPRSPLGGWLVGAVTLLSYAPCSPDCRPTAELAAALLDGLDGAYPGFAARWKARSSGLHALDEAGRCLVLHATGSLSLDLTVDEAWVIAPGDGSGGLTVERDPTLAGVSLRVEQMTLVDAGGGSLRCGLVADHRG